MTENIKLSSEVMKPFSAERYVSKITLVTKLQEITNVIFEGDAVALYFEMMKEVKCDADITELRLKETLTEDSFVAYAKLGSVVWSGESTDVYTDNIRRMAGFIGRGLGRIK